MRTWRCRGQATVVGSSFPVRAFAFEVHSVFPGALNLKPAAAGKDGFLVSLVSTETKAHPRSAVVRGARFDEWEVERGDEGSFDGAVLRFDGSGVRAELPTARRTVSEERPSAGRAVSGHEPRKRLAAGLKAVDVMRKTRGLEPEAAELFGRVGITRGIASRVSAARSYAARFVDGAFALEAAVAGESPEAFLDAARGLAGLGPGLTPAGDDFLCGYLAGLRSRISGGSGLERFLDLVGEAIADPDVGLTPLTNEISAAFLSEAAAGRFGAALVAFADAVVGEGGAIDRAAETLAEVGSSSGLDAALGFLFAFRDRLGVGLTT